jgi:hypothetical protein
MKNIENDQKGEYPEKEDKEDRNPPRGDLGTAVIRRSRGSIRKRMMGHSADLYLRIKPEMPSII